MSRSPRHEVGVGVLVLVALALLAWMSIEIGALRGLRDGVVLQVHLDDAMGLDEGAMVKVAGVSVGHVQSIRVAHDVAVVSLQVDRSAEIRQDAEVQVRARSLLGEKFLELRPQSRDARLLEDGDRLTTVLPAAEIDQLVNGLAPVVATLDPEAVQATMHALSEALEEDPGRAARMLANLDRMLANAADASDGLPALVAEGTAAAREVRSLAAAARPALEDVRAVTARADRSLERIEAATAELPETASEVGALASDAREAVEEGRAVLARVEDKGPQLEAILENLAEIDKWEVRRWLREEGIKVRLRESEVTPEDQ